MWTQWVSNHTLDYYLTLLIQSFLDHCDRIVLVDFQDELLLHYIAHILYISCLHVVALVHWMP